MKSRIEDEKFIEIWNTSASLAEVSQKTGYAKITAGNRAARLGLVFFPKQKTDTAEFLTVWNESGAQAAATAFGISNNAAISLAYRLRKKGHDVADWRGKTRQKGTQ